MTELTILFGTETGNAEMVADDISETLDEAGFRTRTVGMEEYDVDELPTAGTVVFVTSTYGEGELPDTAKPFYDALLEKKPELSSLRFAAFGLGDSTYDTYNNAISTIVELVSSLGATQIGNTGRHDAASGYSAGDLVPEWAKNTLTNL